MYCPDITLTRVIHTIEEASLSARFSCCSLCNGCSLAVEVIFVLDVVAWDERIYSTVQPPLPGCLEISGLPRDSREIGIDGVINKQ